MSVSLEQPDFGARILDWAERLAVHSDPPYAQRGELTVTYLTGAHRACARQLAQWMSADCGFDEVAIDAVGNVVALYHGSGERGEAGERRLLAGSHYDTVRNGGKYDGRLGVLVPMAVVRDLRRRGLRHPFSIEVVAFAEEEGQRFHTAFLGSSALAGSFDPAWLDLVDADGATLKDALRGAGLRAEDIPAIARDPARYLGFVEVHIEQGPVLEALGLPVGVVTSINGTLRFECEFSGTASHAGTTPMGSRHDAAAGAAELLLFAERRAGEVPGLVATVGMLAVPGGSVNVVPGRCAFSLDVRCDRDDVRDACAADIGAEAQRIGRRRGLSFRMDEKMRVGAVPSAQQWQRRWERAIESHGLPVHRMPSGAGHDSMMLARILPQAMLFVRGQHAGISHNPLESITADDAGLAARLFRTLLDQLADDPA